MITLVCSVTYFLYKKDFAKIAKSFKIKNYSVAARPLTRSQNISDIVSDMVKGIAATEIFFILIFQRILN